MEFALGAVYDQLKRPKDAIAAYKRAADLDPDDVHTMGALAQALLNDNQLDEALKEYRQMAEADPEDASTLVHISEILRRQGKYEEALTTVKKAIKKDPDSLEAGYNEGLLLDVLGRYDESAQVYEHMVDLTSHANGAYTADEKNNRAIFLERLGAVYHEQNKVDEAIAAYQKMIDLGGDNSLRGYQNQVDVYRDAKMFDKAIEVSRKAVEANPKNRDLKLMLAGELVDQGKDDEGIAMAKGHAQQHLRRPEGLDRPRPDLHPHSSLEGSRRGPEQGDTSHHQEGRHRLSSVPEGRSGGAAEALRTRQSSTSARRLTSTPTTPWF